MGTQIQPIYRYCLDEDDKIISVNDWWLAFAKENNSGLFDQASVVGKSIWSFISDKPTCSLYEELYEYVRSINQSIKVPFRCDSPTLKRYMQMTISNGVDRQLDCECILLRVANQQSLALLDPDHKRSDACLTMCSFCKRSLIEPEGWIELENISLNLRLFERHTVPAIRYTVCPNCDNQFQELRERSVHHSD